MGKEIIILSQVESFLDALDSKELAKTIHTLELLEMFGHQLKLPHSRHMKNGLLELRIIGLRHIRILYCFKNSTIYLLEAFIKKQQKTPYASIQIAQKRKKIVDNI